MDRRITIRNNPAALGNRLVGTIVYEWRGSRLIIRHTMVDPEFRGQGIASARRRWLSRRPGGERHGVDRLLRIHSGPAPDGGR